MYFSTMDIVLAAIGVLALVGAAIALSAWRHAVKMEREMDRSTDAHPAALIESRT